MNPAAAPSIKQINLDELRGQPARQLGFGAPIRESVANGVRRTAVDNMIGAVKKCMDTPSYALPTIESVTNYFNGPQTENNLQQAFSTVINPLQPSPLAGATNQASTFAEVGKFQTYVLILALQWRLDIEPLNYTVKGNAFPQTQTSKPVSPDAFTAEVGGAGTGDTTAAGVLGLTTTNTMKQATLEWGWWQDIAAYFMARGYQLQWKYGNNFLFLNEDLRFTMHVPSNAQEGSSGSSEIDPLYMARETNLAYQGLNSANQFGLINYSRFGNQNLGAAGQSVFHPTRAYDTVAATYGGAGSRSVLRCNSEWKRLTCPILAGPGVPIGLTAVQQSEDFVLAMQAWLDVNFGLGTNDFTESVNINTGATIGGTPGLTGVEPSFDAVSVANSLQVFADRVVFKGGRWSLTLAFKGVEMSSDQAALYKDGTTRAMISANTGMMISPKQLWHA
jgi:hypothetical protein